LPPSGQTLQSAFESLIEVLDRRGVRYAIIDGLATIQHSRVRTTNDIDVLLSVPQLEMPGLFEALRDQGFEIDLHANVRELRDEGLTSIRYADTVVDMLKPVIPAYAHVLERAIDAEIFGRRVRICAAEGLLVMKLIAMRPQDEADIQELLTAYAGRLDLDFVRAELDTSAEADDPRRVKFEQWVQRIVK
jgi:predicted nucleotidyltransferase